MVEKLKEKLIIEKRREEWGSINRIFVFYIRELMKIVLVDKLRNRNILINYIEEIIYKRIKRKIWKEFVFWVVLLGNGEGDSRL